jgi:predicted  nucleic acid-binding Zn-ribbon protein
MGDLAGLGECSDGTVWISDLIPKIFYAFPRASSRLSSWCDATTSRSEQPSLRRCLEERRAEHATELSECSALLARAGELRSRASGLTRRHELHERGDLLRQAAVLERRVAEIEKGAARFESRSKEYLDSKRREWFESGVQTVKAFSAEFGAVSTEGAAAGQCDVCAGCGEQLVLHTQLSLLLCPLCGRCTEYLETPQGSSTAVDDGCCSSAVNTKRIAHWLEYLRVLKDSPIEIPDEILGAVMAKLREDRVGAKEVTIQKVRDALRALKFKKKWYDHAHRITARLEGVEPPRLSAEQEEKFKLMFIAASSSFQKYCPESRTNFLSYSFCGRKIAEILGYTEFIPYFASLKCTEKLARAEGIFQKICEDRNWPTFPSVEGSAECSNESRPESRKRSLDELSTP